jgi:nucleoside-triphosphatase THEP1
MLEALVRELHANGVVVAGVIQHNAARRDRTRCDMRLEDIATGTIIGLSEDRGPHSRGCRIDEGGLAAAAPLIEHALETLDPALLVINKFGKIESEGRGLRHCIAKAVSLDVPVLIGVPTRNLDAWNAFAGELSVLIEAKAIMAQAWLRSVMAGPPAQRIDWAQRDNCRELHGRHGSAGAKMRNQLPSGDRADDL